ncbi:MAG: DnaJ domain-containing protein [candidate division Zixibacteria bacterium]|nr:DnaJ domain-containing protein [candidate division Zixibacteria bacterium]
MKNYYKILDISYNAKPAEIKSSYRRLAKKYHPDTSGKMPDDFITITEAFDILYDAGKRRLYNKKLGLNTNASTPYQTDRIKLYSVKKDVYDDLLEVFSDRFKMGKKRKLIIDLFLSDDEFKNGAQTTISIPHDKICPRCFGFGGTIFSTCRICGGIGLVSEDIVFDIKLTPPLSVDAVHEVIDGDYTLRFRLKRGNI